MQSNWISKAQKDKTFCGIEKQIHKKIQIKVESKIKTYQFAFKKIVYNINKLDKLFFDLYYLDQKDLYNTLISQNLQIVTRIKDCFNVEITQSINVQIYNHKKIIFLAKKYLQGNLNNIKILQKKLGEEYFACFQNILEITQSQLARLQS